MKLGRAVIEEKILAAEKEAQFIKRAVKARICPECGGALSGDHGGSFSESDEGSFETRYTCEDCNFRYTKW